MAENYAFLKENINDIKLDDFKTAMAVCLKAGVNHIAPLGCSGDTFYLHGKFIPSAETKDGYWKRQSVVTIRNYCGSPELLISDKAGNTLYYGKYYHMEFNNMAEEYFRVFSMLKDKVDKCGRDFKQLEVKFAEDAVVDEMAFDLLTKYYETKTA